jgi:predicted dehydrogenase
VGLQLKRIRLGMVGGGQGAFIGPVHRVAVRLDDQYQLLAGALSSDTHRARASAQDIGIDSDRSYVSYQEMAEAESRREDGIEAVSIVTPNDSHAEIARAFLNRGIHVICDKPLVLSTEQGQELREAARLSGCLVAVTYNYRGYPMVRQARAMCAEGLLGNLRLVDIEYLQDWLSTRVEASGSKQALWRTDPERTGGVGAIGDIGVHGYDLCGYITGLHVTSVCAELTSFVQGRLVDDDVRASLRFETGAKGRLWASQVAIGNANGLSIRIYGDLGALEWKQSDPGVLLHAAIGSGTVRLDAGGPGSNAAVTGNRLPAGHPEGYYEAFATVYSEIARAIRALQCGDELPSGLPDLDSGLDAVEFVEAAVNSHRAGNVWTPKHRTR